MVVRYGLTSVHHESGDLFALQQVRARGELLHRVSFETSGDILEAMIKNGISSGFGDEWIRFGATSEHIRRSAHSSGAYHGAEPALCRHQSSLQRQHHRDAGEISTPGQSRVQRAGIQPNCHALKGCCHRHGAYRVRASAARLRHDPPCAPRSSLHTDQR